MVGKAYVGYLCVKVRVQGLGFHVAVIGAPGACSAALIEVYFGSICWEPQE